MIHYEVSRNPRLLEQYCELRQACFRRELGIADYDGAQDERDRQGHILVAHDEGRVVAGIRISPELPPTEHLGELEVDTRATCTWERLACHPEVRSVHFSREFLGRLIASCRELAFEHALVFSSLRNARFYRLSHTALGIPFEIVRVAPEFARGKFADLEHYLSVSHLRDAH